MTDSVSLGKDAKFYIDTNDDWDAPSWLEIDIVRDVTVNLTKDEWDASTRGTGGYKARVGTLKDVSLDIDILKQPDDTGYGILKAAYFEDDNIHCLILDGDKDEAGHDGIQGWFQVFSMTEGQPLLEGITNKFSLKITISENPTETVTT